MNWKLICSWPNDGLSKFLETLQTMQANPKGNKKGKTKRDIAVAKFHGLFQK